MLVLTVFWVAECKEIWQFMLARGARYNTSARPGSLTRRNARNRDGFGMWVDLRDVSACDSTLVQEEEVHGVWVSCYWYSVCI